MKLEKKMQNQENRAKTDGSEPFCPPDSMKWLHRYAGLVKAELDQMKSRENKRK